MTTDAKRVTLAEVIAAMSKSADDAPFRWFQDSYPDRDGSIQAGETLLLTVGQVRKELAAVAALRARIATALQLAADSGEPLCQCCGVSWIDHSATCGQQ